MRRQNQLLAALIVAALPLAACSGMAPATPSALSTTSLSVLGAAAGDSGARISASAAKERFDVVDEQPYYFGTCDDLVTATGRLTVSSSDKKFNVSFHGKGVGLTGTEYNVKYVVDDMVNFKENGASHIKTSITIYLVSKGKTPNWMLVLKSHFVIKDGEVTQSHEQIKLPCGA